MGPKIDINKFKHLPITEDIFVNEYEAKGIVSRDESEVKYHAWYYAEVSKNAHKSVGITQLLLAEKIGKKRKYVGTVS